MKLHEVFTLCLLALITGIILGYIMFSFKIDSHRNFYIEHCIANNKTDYLDVHQVSQCINSFNIFKSK